MEETDDGNFVHLHREIEYLKQTVVDKQQQLTAMETHFLRETDRLVELEDSIIAWQDKYDRLYESHKRVQKVNQNLEDKLLKLADINAAERSQLTGDVATLSVRVAQSNYNIANMQRQIERYKNDISLAIQLLQCKPADHFVAQKLSTLPKNIQTRVAPYIRIDSTQSDSEGSPTGAVASRSNPLLGALVDNSRNNVLYRVIPESESPPPLCPFPPTAMVYSMRGLDAAEDNDDGDLISPGVIVNYLKDELRRGGDLHLRTDPSEARHCTSCQCKRETMVNDRETSLLSINQPYYSVGTQTLLNGEAQNALCLRCNSNLNSPSRTTSPHIMKLVKPVDQVELSRSTFGDSYKLDELQVNPILGHHRLCNDRTTVSKSKPNGVLLDNSRSPTDSRPVIVPHSVATGTNTATLEKNVTGGGVQGRSNTSTAFNGTKAFEDFNRTLINNLKVNNPIRRPRLCSLQINQDGANILLENADCQQRSMYTRRPKLVDEELEENTSYVTIVSATKTVANNPMPAPSPDDPQIEKGETESLLLELTNKTDSEKVREAAAVTQQQQQHQQIQLTANTKPLKASPVHDPSDASSAKTSDNSITALRQEQLDRVAVWVQQNKEHQSHGQSVCLNAIPNNSVCIPIKNDDNTADDNGLTTKEQPQDLAQMEYNVKQFLLKQNEWSMHSGANMAREVTPNDCEPASATPIYIHSGSETNL